MTSLGMISRKFLHQLGLKFQGQINAIYQGMSVGDSLLHEK